MENVHTAIAWYQKKTVTLQSMSPRGFAVRSKNAIGSYDKQLWEQSVEKKLQKQPPFVLHNAPRKKVRLKTEYIDVDLIRGSTFTKTKPQVPWVYITRKAISRVLFFPFYYNWWVTQTSKQLYGLLLVLYVLQVVTIFVYVRNFDHSIMEDELSFTEVILPTILMFLLCLIHSQTVLAHINHKPPKRAKSISGVTRKPRPKKTSRKGRSSGNNSTCAEDGANTDSTKPSRRRSPSPRHTTRQKESHSSNSALNGQDAAAPSIDMEKSLMSRCVSDYDLKPATSSTHNDAQASTSLNSHHQSHHHHHLHQEQNHQHQHRHHHSESVRYDSRATAAHHESTRDGSEECSTENEKVTRDQQSYEGVWGDGTNSVQKSGCSYNLLDNLPNFLTVEKVCCDVSTQNDACDEVFENGKVHRKSSLDSTNVVNSSSKEQSRKRSDSVCLKVISRENVSSVAEKVKKAIHSDCVVSEKTHLSHRTESVPKGDMNETEKLVHDKIHVSVNSDPPANVEQTNSVPSGIENSMKHMPSSSHQAACEGPSPSHIPKSNHSVTGQNYSYEPAKQWAPCANCASARESAEGGQCRKSNGTDTGGSPADLDNGRGEEEMLQYDTQDSCDSGINESPSMLNNRMHPHECERGWSLDDDHPVVSHDDNTVDNACAVSAAPCALVQCCDCGHEKGIFSHPTNTSVSEADLQNSTSSTIKSPINQDISPGCSDSSSNDPPTFRERVLQNHTPTKAILDVESQYERNCKTETEDDNQSPLPPVPQILVRAPSVPHDKHSLSVSVSHPLSVSSSSIISTAERRSSATEQVPGGPLPESSSHLQCFSEQFVQEILNEETMREMSYTSLLVHSDLENSSSSISHLSTTSAMSSTSTASSSCKVASIDDIPQSTPSSAASVSCAADQKPKSFGQESQGSAVRRGSSEKSRVSKLLEEDRLNPLDESLDQINMSDGERPSDDVSNYNPSDSDADSDGPLHEDLRNRCEEKWKRLRFQEQVTSDGSAVSKASLTPGTGTASAGGGPRSVVGILTRKPSPLKDLALGRKTSNNTAAANSSGSDQEQGESRNQLRRRRRTSGTPEESCRGRSVPTSLGIRSDSKPRHLSSSENETGGGHTPEGSNKGSSDKEKATMSSEEWEDRMQSDETTSSAYSSNSEVDSDEKVEEEEERTEYTTSTLHVINLLQPQSGSPTSSGNVTQPDKVSCVIWEGNECKKVDLTALDIGWAIIDKVDSLPESSDYFFIGLLFSFLLSLVPLVFRAYANKEVPSFEDLLSWSWYFAKLCEVPALSQSYSWRQYLVMVNGILQRFFLSLIFFFLLTVADRTFKQRLLYAKHFSYLTSSRRARKFSMPHFRLNKVRNIKIWLSLRSYLKRRGPQRSVDVIVSACFLCAICTVCLISLQMLKDTDNYLDYLCNWELLVWCVALAVFLMRFMTVGLKINKKYRNLSVLITEQINLYLQMEQKPHKKEELILANNVLRLAEDLLKELESPFKISGFSANPLIYNIMRVVVLSAFSAVLTEVLGFKLKLHKIKLKG